MYLVWILHNKERCNLHKSCSTVIVVRHRKITVACTHAQGKADTRIQNFGGEDDLLEKGQ
jgi:hypothetical protein